MKLGDEYTLTIEKMTNLGLGLARTNNFVIFVKNACPKDKVKIKITKVNKSYANAEIVEIIEPSPYRIKPFCPMFSVCGACQLQFIHYNYQLELKQQIVRDALEKIGGIGADIPLPIPSPQTQNYRHKIQYPISQTKNSKKILAGYYKPATHEIVNIKYCPAQPEICDSIIEFIRQNAAECNISGYNEKYHCGDLRHVVIRHSSFNAENLVILVVNDSEIKNKYTNLAKLIFENFKEVNGVCLNFNNRKTNVILGARTVCIKGSDTVKEKILDKVFVIGADTFFQINPKSAENIFKYVKDYISRNFEKPLVLDAYAGISAFGICVSDNARKVVSIEENEKSVELAKQSAVLNNIENIEFHSGDAGEYFSEEKRKFEVIILDPPRKGCSEQSLEYALKLCSDTIFYVSCNPATLARDLKYLKEKGCEIVSIQPFDMFCHTYHIENVAIIKV